jgi:hypothetical protein
VPKFVQSRPWRLKECYVADGGDGGGMRTQPPLRPAAAPPRPPRRQRLQRSVQECPVKKRKDEKENYVILYKP